MCEQRFGYLDLALENLKKVETIVKQVDDYSSYYVACCYLNMAYVYCGEGDSKKARFYNNFVDFFLKEAQPLSAQYFNLNHVSCIVDYMSRPNSPFITPDGIIHIFEKTARQDMPQQWKDEMYDCENITIHNVEDKIKIYNGITYCLNGSKHESSASSYISDIMYSIMNTGMSITLYTYADSIHFNLSCYVRTYVHSM